MASRPCTSSDECRRSPSEAVAPLSCQRARWEAERTARTDGGPRRCRDRGPQRSCGRRAGLARARRGRAAERRGRLSGPCETGAGRRTSWPGAARSAAVRGLARTCSASASRFAASDDDGRDSSSRVRAVADASWRPSTICAAPALSSLAILSSISALARRSSRCSRSSCSSSSRICASSGLIVSLADGDPSIVVCYVSRAQSRATHPVASHLTGRLGRVDARQWRPSD